MRWSFRQATGLRAVGWKRLATAAALVAAGYLLGRSHGTLETYLKSKSGDYFIISSYPVWPLYELGEVRASYPGNFEIVANMSNIGTTRATRDLNISWKTGHLTITCYDGAPQLNNALLVDPGNALVKDSLILREGLRETAGQRKTSLAVSSDGLRVKLNAEGVKSFLDFMALVPFPRTVSLTTDADSSQFGLYSIPTIGVQQPATVMSLLNLKSGEQVPVFEPPSDPFRVMKRLCGYAPV